MFRMLATWLVIFYQRWISPYKGFTCAHRAWHGGLSCSEYALAVIETNSTVCWWPLMKQRFSKCQAAGSMILEMRENSDQPPPSDSTEESEPRRRRFKFARFVGDQRPSKTTLCVGEGCQNVCLPCIACNAVVEES